jgi:BTB/POZ domain
MHRMYQNRRLCDVVLHCDGVDISCHRILLAASSIYFERMFLNDMSESRAAKICLVGVVSDALQRLVDFAYTSRLPVASDTVLDTFEAADMLEFPRARQFCEQFVSELVDENNCLALLMYADAYSSTALYDRSRQCIAKHFQVTSCVSVFSSMHVD